MRIECPKPDGTVNVTSVDLAGQQVSVVTMQAGKAPEVKADGNKIAVGGQTVAWDGKKFVFAR